MLITAHFSFANTGGLEGLDEIRAAIKTEIDLEDSKSKRKVSNLLGEHFSEYIKSVDTLVNKGDTVTQSEVTMLFGKLDRISRTLTEDVLEHITEPLCKGKVGCDSMPLETIERVLREIRLVVVNQQVRLADRLEGDNSGVTIHATDDLFILNNSLYITPALAGALLNTAIAIKNENIAESLWRNIKKIVTNGRPNTDIPLAVRGLHRPAGVLATEIQLKNKFSNGEERKLRIHQATFKKTLARAVQVAKDECEKIKDCDLEIVDDLSNGAEEYLLELSEKTDYFVSSSETLKSYKDVWCFFFCEDGPSYLTKAQSAIARLYTPKNICDGPIETCLENSYKDNLLAPDFLSKDDLGSENGLFSVYVARIISLMISISAGLAVIMLIVVGFLWIYEGESAYKRKFFRDRLLDISLGLFILLTSTLIINTISPDLLGQSETNQNKEKTNEQ